MSNQTNNLNIESLIAKISYELVSEKILDKKEINKLLGVLASNGVYAMWVYALDKLEFSFKKTEEEQKKVQIFAFLGKIAELDKFITQSLDFDNLIKNIVSLTNQIERLSEEIKKLKEDIEKIKKNNHANKDDEDLNKKIKEKEEKEKEKKNLEKERMYKLNESFQYFQNISNDLHNLLFLKQLLEKTFIYARYHAQALGD